jgi:nucleotide-binding universal stress UspA family protein
VIFDRIVCGVDGSPASLAAVMQSSRLVAPSGTLVLVAALDPWNVAAPSAGRGPVVEGEPARPEGVPRNELRAIAESALDEAAAVAARPVEREVIAGWAPTVLREVTARPATTLVAVGMHARARAAGILLGSVATAVLHEARCSVFLARGVDDPAAFPRAVVVGVDESPEAQRLAAVSADLRGRFDAELRPVTALGGVRVEEDTRHELEAAHRLVFGAPLGIDPRGPVDALVEASGDVDLLVVGSRGLHGARSLGSVSERVAHGASCSVLVVRDRDPS